MRQFRLKPTVKLDLQAESAHLRDVASGRVVTLSRTEGMLMSALGREMSPDDIVHRVSDRTAQMDQATVLALFTRLAAAGFLDTEVEETPRAPPAPSLDEVVPCIRNDLDFVPGRKLGLMEVKDLARNRSFTLYDFEANIARMLDGHRTIGQVAEAAERLGIETSPDALRNFFRQLKAFGFLADKAVPIQPPRGRKPWMPEIREMYRHALRHSRRGELAQAEEYLVALLQVDAEVPEAKALLAQVRDQKKGASTPGLDFQALHGHRHYVETPEPAPQAPNPFQRFDHDAVEAPAAPALRTTKRSPSPPTVAPTLAPPAPPVALSSQSLPPLWTVSTVVSSMKLPEVSDSVLAFDPSSQLQRTPPPAEQKPSSSAEADVPWDYVVTDG
jgi:hypothetical protein